MPRWHLVGCRIAPAIFWGACPVPAVWNAPPSTPGRRGPGAQAGLSSHLVTGQSPQPPDVGTGTIWAFRDFTWLTADFDFKVFWSGNRTKEKGSCREQEAMATSPPTPHPGVRMAMMGRTATQETTEPGFRAGSAAYRS